MPTVRDVEALLEEEAKNVAIKKQQDDEADSRRDDRHDRRSDRHDRRDRSRDRYRHRESNGDRRRSRERDHRARDGSRPRSTKGADTDEDDKYRRSSSRDRYRGSRRDRGGDYYSGGGRARSRSPRRDRDRDSRYRERRDRSNHRGRDDRREGRGSGAPKTPTPEVDVDDRDSRTVFVQQISQRAETADLRKFFKKAGDVVEAQIVKDRVTHRSKGVGYVEFAQVESVAKALEMTGQKLKGVPIICQLTEAEKNRAPRPSEGGPAPGANGAPFHRLYVGNIHFSVAEDDLKEIFTPYGELEQVILQRDEANPSRSKGYGFVQFVEPNDAKAALAEMNGFELAGRQIRVGLGNDKFTPESTANLLRSFSQHTQNYQGSGVFGAGGRGAHAGGSGGTFDRANGRDDRAAGGASALDDSDVGGVNYKSYDRGKLMNNLARGEIAQPNNPTATSIVNQRRVTVEQPAASRCIKIENAFNTDEEQNTFGDIWITSLTDDVKGECEKKYGKVVHIAVDPNSDGEIFVKFEDVSGGQRAMQGLNGRSFNNRFLRASYVVDAIYNTQWPAAVGKA